jgi:hypothetical protein
MGMQMKSFILLLAIICAGASIGFYVVNDAVGNVPNWAYDVCSAARQLCHSSQQLAYAAAGLAALWVMMKFWSAVRD